MSSEEKKEGEAFAKKLVQGLLPLNRLMVEAVFFAIVMHPDWDHATKMMIATYCHSSITVKRDSGPHTNFRAAVGPYRKKEDIKLLLSSYRAKTFFPFLQCRLMKALNVLLNGNTKLKKRRSFACGWGQPRANAPIVPMPESMHTLVDVCSKVVIEFLDRPESSDWCALTRVFTILEEQSEASGQTLSIAVYVMCAHEKLNKQLRSRLTALLFGSKTPMHLNRCHTDLKDSTKFADAEMLVNLRLQPAQAPAAGPPPPGPPPPVVETAWINPNDWDQQNEIGSQIEDIFYRTTQSGMNTSHPRDWVQNEIFFPPDVIGPGRSSSPEKTPPSRRSPRSSRRSPRSSSPTMSGPLTRINTEDALANVVWTCEDSE